MGAPSTPNAELKAVVRLVESFLRLGYPPKGPRGTQRATALCAAGVEAERRGWFNKGRGEYMVRNYCVRAEKRGFGPDWSIKPRRKAKPRIAAQIVAAGPRTYSKTERVGQTLRVVVIPDVHLSPELSPERMSWIGRYCRDEAPDHVVQLGDLGTFDSVSSHAKPGTIDFEKLPRVEKDFACIARGLDLFDKSAGNLRALRTITKGNHEYRLDRFENANPQTQGLFVDRFDGLMRARDWRVYPFREYAKIGGVGFIHIPINAGGKPYGGKMSAHAIARDSVFSIVHGHTHVRQSVHVAKLGESRLVSVISPGCALPWGHVEDYAKHNATGWFWGVACLTIRDGAILDEAYVSMETLERRYRERKVARVR